MEENKNLQISNSSPALERGPVWLKKRRHALSKDFNLMPLPERGLHLWRYTDPEKFLFDNEKICETTYGENFTVVEKLEKDNLKKGNLACLVTDMGGRDISVYKSESFNDDIVVCSLSDAVEKYQQLINQHLYSLVSSKNGKFEAMNGALWNDGIFIYIPDGKTLDKPIHLLRESGLSNSSQFPRLLIIAGENAEATIIDEYGGGSIDANKGVSYTNSAVEIIAGDDSRMRYISIQRMSPGANTYLTHRANLGAGASMLTIPLAFGSAVSKANFGIILNGQGADSKIYGMTFGSNHQHTDNHTLHQHNACHTTSDINFKVVLKDKALSAYTGLIKIEHDAKTCEAYQENRNLLLNSGCKAEAIPELEILNEDVMCSHGATIGPIDPEMIFYLLSRGISKKEAVRMIVSGFVTSTLLQMPEDIRNRITEFVTQRLENI